MARVLWLSLSISLSLALAACKKDRPEDSILLLTIDTLRADHLHTYGYFRKTSPRIDAFGEEALLFEHAITPMATTLPAHLSMMTSTRPLRHGVVRNGLRFEPDAHLTSLAMMLSRAGYTTAAFVSAAPVSKGSGINAGFTDFDEPDGTNRRAEETVSDALAWFEAHAKDDQPFFVWIHLFDPHDPYDPPGEYAKAFTKSEAEERFVVSTGARPIHRLGKHEYDVLDINNRYDGEILYADAQVGRLFDRLGELGTYDDTTIVLAADHGEGLWQHNWHDHGRIYNEQIFVPLIVKPPESEDLEPRRISALASTLDIVPTLDGMLDLPLTDAERAQLEGVDLLQDRRAFVFSQRVEVHRRGWERGDKFALSTPEWKLFALSDGDDQLFDVVDDPHELENVIDAHPNVAVSMKRQVNSILAGYLAKNAAPRKRVDHALIEKLRALGYLE